MKFNSLNAGMTVYSVSKSKMGNTTIRTVSVHAVNVISTDLVKETVLASWNGNYPKTFHATQYTKWRKSKPILIRSVIGSARLASRDEIAAAKSKIGEEADHGSR
jgi:hypothetical protein